MRFTLFLIIIYCCAGLSSAAQQTSVTFDTVVFRIQVTGKDGKPLAATLYFSTEGKTKKYAFDPDAQGRVVAKVPTGYRYTVTVDGSADSYEYDIPNVSISPVDAVLKFVKSGTQDAVMVGLYFLNAGELKQVDIVDGSSKKHLVRSVEGDTIFIQLPANSTYSLGAGKTTISNNLIDTKNAAGKALNYVLRFSNNGTAALSRVDADQAVFQVHQTNLYNVPVPSSALKVHGKYRNTDFSAITDSAGKVSFILPCNDHYFFSIPHFSNVYDIDIRDPQEYVLVNEIRLKYPGLKELEQRRKEDSLRIAKRDSEYLLFEKSKEKSATGLSQEVTGLVADAVKNKKINEQWFVEQENTVGAVLYRHKDVWKSRMIVTDVTGSMYPYMKQVALWHVLEMMEKTPSDYVFFNDGDNLPDAAKVTGSTGGIYFCMKQQPDSVISTMYTAMFNGNGGDAPENNIEAMLAAVQQKKMQTELILVADSYSPVKDMALLEKLKVPVRVVLCGSATTWPNTDYLEIAWRTGGSIHTIEEDISTLSKLHDEDRITINGMTYQFMGGRFLALNKRL